MSRELSITTRYDSDAKVWVSECPTLGIYSQGESEEEAALAIKEAIGLSLQTSFAQERSA